MSFASSRAVGSSVPFATWEAILNAHFDNRILTLLPTEDGANPAQLAGVDAFALFTNGAVRTVDFKVDTYTTNRLALEIVSNDTKDTPGWLVDPKHLNDLLIYFKPNLNKAYVFYMCDLRRLYLEQKDRWHRFAANRESGFMEIRSKNTNYETFCLGVPDFVLLGAMGMDCLIELPEGTKS